MPLVFLDFFVPPNSKFLLMLQNSFRKSALAPEIMLSPFSKTLSHMGEGRHMSGEHYSARQEELHSKRIVQIKCAVREVFLKEVALKSQAE